MFGIPENYEKWMDTPIFHCPSDDHQSCLQLLHMKCFALTIMNSCVMNILVVKRIQLYLTGLLSICALMMLLSPHLMGKIIPIIFLVFAFSLSYLKGHLIFRYGTFYIYCLICCKEVEGFEFLFDLYLIVCYVVETVYSFHTTRRYDIVSTVICEFGMWTIPCSTMFRLAATFGYLAIEGYNYRQVWPLSVFFVTVSTHMFIARIYGFDYEDQIQEFRRAVEFVFEFLVTNSSLLYQKKNPTNHELPS